MNLLVKEKIKHGLLILFLLFTLLSTTCNKNNNKSPEDDLIEHINECKRENEALLDLIRTVRIIEDSLSKIDQYFIDISYQEYPGKLNYKYNTDNILNKIDHIKSIIDSFNQQLAEYGEEIENYDQRIETYESRLEYYKKRISDLENGMEDLETEKDYLNIENQNLIDKIIKCQNNLSNSQKDILRLTDKINDLEKKITYQNRYCYVIFKNGYPTSKEITSNSFYLDDIKDYIIVTEHNKKYFDVIPNKGGGIKIEINNDRFWESTNTFVLFVTKPRKID